MTNKRGIHLIEANKAAKRDAIRGSKNVREKTSHEGRKQLNYPITKEKEKIK